MRSHPHVHLLVTADGLSRDRTQGLAPKHPAYLVPVEALSPIFRAKMCAGLKQAGLLDQVPPAVWQKNWVVHCQPAGRGPQVLDYLGRYVFRIAISNRRLERIEAGQVTFRYRDHRTQTLRRVRLSGVEFLHRFLQHVLPSGCTKVRHSGLWSPTVRGPLAHAGLPRVRGAASSQAQPSGLSLRAVGPVPYGQSAPGASLRRTAPVLPRRLDHLNTAS